LRQRASPVGLMREKIAREDECGRGHALPFTRL
jgi:hypothetical protein